MFLLITLWTLFQKDNSHVVLPPVGYSIEIEQNMQFYFMGSAWQIWIKIGILTSCQILQKGWYVLHSLNRSR